LAQDEARRNGRRAQSQETARPEPAAQMPVMPETEPRASFDVDLGPDMSSRALQEAVEHDPLEPVVIGPGGTFGLDPLEQLGKREKKAPQRLEPVRQEAEPEEDFSLHLEATPDPDTTSASELDDLIQKAM